jgi:hypothetical protein
VSVQAITWVLEKAPEVPPHLVALLLSMANHANEHGRGSYAGVTTLAWYTRKNERSVRRDIDQALELGLIRLGDQRFVLHIDPDKRPVVYDLAMERERNPRPRPGRPGRPAKQQVSDPVVNGGVSTPPRLTNREDAHDKSGGSPRQIGGVPTPPEPFLEPREEPPPARGRAREAPTEPAGGAGESPQPQALANLVDEVHQMQPGWRPDRIRRALTDAVSQGRAAPVVAEAMRLVAADPATRSPQRLLEDGDWWVRAVRTLRRQQTATQAPPAPCKIHSRQNAATCSGCRGDALARDDRRQEAGPPLPGRDAAEQARRAVACSPLYGTTRHRPGDGPQRAGRLLSELLEVDRR